MFWTVISVSISVQQKHQFKTQAVQPWSYVKCDKCHYTWLNKIQVCLLQKVLKKNAFSNYISNIYFGKNIKCEHWYYKVRTGNALKDHTKAVHKGITIKYDTCAFGQFHFCKV